MRGRGSAEPKAGESAKAVYDDLRKQWLRRKRRFFAILALILLAIVGLATSLAVWVDTKSWWWMAGLVTGGALAVWVIVRDSPPSAIENWLVGSWGEEATAKALRQLPSEWVVRHDIDTGRGNIDHLVIGPGGVFVLETKLWSGAIVVDGDTAYVRMPGRDRADVRKDVSRQVKSAAREIYGRVRQAMKINQFVRPVVVIWGDFDQRVVGEGPTFIAGQALAGWLTSEPAVIAPNRLTQISAAVEAAWPRAGRVRGPSAD